MLHKVCIYHSSPPRRPVRSFVSATYLSEHSHAQNHAKGQEKLSLRINFGASPGELLLVDQLRRSWISHYETLSERDMSHRLCFGWASPSTRRRLRTIPFPESPMHPLFPVADVGQSCAVDQCLPIVPVCPWLILSLQQLFLATVMAHESGEEICY